MRINFNLLAVILGIFYLSIAAPARSDVLSEIYHKLSTQELPWLQESIIQAIEEHNQDEQAIIPIAKRAYALWYDKINSNSENGLTTVTARSFLGKLVPTAFNDTMDNQYYWTLIPDEDIQEFPFVSRILDTILLTWGAAFSKNTQTFNHTKKALTNYLNCDHYRCSQESDRLAAATEHYEEHNQNLSAFTKALEAFKACKERREEYGTHLQAICDALEAEATRLINTMLV
ncbi:MAG: hypothetical protein ACR2PX_28185 [Endozoicomonas sp.]|uniref:hypothetical protein n=1 Tax=Endozoicomonas sp. TaxID=1892382 RepID=UPI003D9B392E